MLFARLEFASNTAAKRQLRRFDRDYIIYTKDLPKDVSFIKLLLYTIFFGVFGVHYYYVGKYFKGFFMSLSFVYLILCTVFNAYIMNNLEAYSSLIFFPIGVAALSWIVSLTLVISKKFKVPILVDIPKDVQDDLKAKKEDFQKFSQELKAENEKLRQEQTGGMEDVSDVKNDDVVKSQVAEKCVKSEKISKSKKNVDSFKIIEKVLGIKKK